MKNGLLMLCLLFGSAQASWSGGPELNPLSPWYLQDAERWWHVDALLGAELEPDYVGSDDSEVEPTGFVRALFRDRFGNRYTIGIGEVGAVFYPGKRWAFAMDFEYEEGRETENEALQGLMSGDSTLEGEFALFRRFGNGYGFAVYQPDLLGRGKGVVYFLGYGYDHLTPQQRWLFSPRLDVSWGDPEHMQTEFGLTPAQAAAIGQTPYRAPGGLKSTTVGISVQRFFDRRLAGGRWSLLGSVEIEAYHSKAADSPLLAVLGSDTTVEATLGAFIRF